MFFLILLNYVISLHAKASALPQKEILIPYWECRMEDIMANSTLICQMLQPVEFKFTRVLQEGDCSIEDMFKYVVQETGKVERLCKNYSSSNSFPGNCLQLREPPPEYDYISWSGFGTSRKCQVAAVSAAVWNAGDPFQITLVIGQAKVFGVDPMVVNLTNPSGAQQSHVLTNWVSTWWTIPGKDLLKSGPPDWVVGVQGTPCTPDLEYMYFDFAIELTLNLTHQVGNYTLEIGLHRPVQLVFNPLIVNPSLLHQNERPIVGSHVVKMDLKETVLVNPRLSLKEVQVDLRGLNTSYMLPQCAPYLIQSYQGITRWTRF